MKDDSWMEKTKGGKRTSAYTNAPPKREPVRTQKGNVADIIREKNQRTRKQTD